MRRSADLRNEIADDPTWWRNAIFYQVYVRSFADSDADGVGDLEGIRGRLGYLELLGVDALWLSPFFRSPMVDHGYDVTDPRDVDPLFGDLAALDRLVADAHAHGMRVTLDLVPNRTSDQHAWFQAALRSAPGSPERGRYVFRDGRGAGGELPPNDWTSMVGGPAWTRLPDGQWFLHLFTPRQPDLNWAHPDVWTDLERTLRFWLDLGIDGFRVDVAHGMAGAVDAPEGAGGLLVAAETPTGSPEDDAPRFDVDGVHEIHRRVRAVLDEYPGRVATGEVRADGGGALPLPDGLHLGFDFRLLATPFDADAAREAIERSLAAASATGRPPTWTLSNHDVGRHVSRYGGGDAGTRRARAMALVELALPGVVYLYNGEELGLPDVDLAGWARQDPIFHGTGGARRGRDGARVPLPWEGEVAPYGFTTGASTWLPMPEDWGRLTAEAQLEDPDSMLSLYRQAIELRRTHPAFEGDEIEWYGAPPGCFAFRRKGGGLICALNTSGGLVPLPPGDVVLGSGPLEDGQLPPDTAVWLV
ncbi:alpha-glucosidase [Streptoalloteichus tenebrarius]|uniref:Alpha-glucosidase n=1 Tax=Streptoalloteichus tenebrarius (strain ATCC 17920 / DSM 40477 / JCM 4838 / CBS 697.72 / NBRC 16177 / NCIMB 11028 / NRRL B-12390 / A12253. 1 / ISP 5477) TaxID=1933 RepID=A0ABT1HW44_STRSD|nr:alpha-amylase family glycosyl hydrolase [Streptoalloteichus tenebrarius]MCP2259735.1 alpha-glucosidase [Streptoalloteichus tenebrarius]BFF00716.1 glycoside hydrolase family 13 protein [Streptoalloteichus tenebrarius]